MLATVLLAGCSSSGSEPEARVEARAAQPSPTTVDTTTFAEEPASTTVPDSPPPAESGTADFALPGDVEEDNPVPRAARAPARRAAGSPAAPRETSAADRIDIPKIGLSHRTYEGIDMPTLNRGPSHWPGTALPGQRGNAVFPGHRTTYSRPFWDIDKLVPGDEVAFTSASGRFVYRVTDTFVVGANETWIADDTEEATFTIFACHPKGSARQRYVVKGRLTTPPIDQPSPPTTSAPSPSSPPPSTTTTTTSPPPAQQPPLIPGLPG